MKMTQEHYKIVENAMRKVMADNPTFTPELYQSKGKSAMFYRWDLFNNCGLLDFTCHTLYTYLNDTHIDTALKQITNTNTWKITKPQTAMDNIDPDFIQDAFAKLDQTKALFMEA